MELEIANGLKTWMEEIVKIPPSSFNQINFGKYRGPYELITQNHKTLRGPRSVLQYWSYIESFSPEIFLIMGWGFSYKVAKNALYAFHDKHQKLPSLNNLFENPYILIGFGRVQFKKIDHIALNEIGLKEDSPVRILGYVKHILSQASSSGHLYLSQESVLSKVCDNLNLKFSLDDLMKMIKNDSLETVVLDHNMVYSGWAYNVEKRSSEMMCDLIYKRTEDLDITQFIDNFQKREGIQFSENQNQAVHMALENNSFILTGLPGTGKTTLTKCLCSMFKNILGEDPLLLTPTGVAAKNLQEMTQLDAFTIHRALEYRGGHWEYNEHRKYSTKVVIVDEVSMVDQVVFYHLLAAIDTNTRLILIGDTAQLPSVGPGNVLRELIGSKQIPTVSLTEIFRQEEASDIVLNAHRINKGQSITITDKKPADFMYISGSDQVELRDFIIKASQKLFKDEKDFQVIAPMYRGDVGVDSLNEHLRDSLNPASKDKKEMTIGGIRFRVGDRIIITKNMYKLQVYNGDIGKIRSIDFKTKEIVIKIFKPFRYLHLKTNDDALHTMGMKLAYAITVHKIQGLEFDYIILPLVMSFFPLLQRNLLYTGITRARKKLILLGEKKAIGKAIQNNKPIQRNSLLGKRIIEILYQNGEIQKNN